MNGLVPGCVTVFYKGKLVLGSAQAHNRAEQHGGRPGGGAAGLQGPVWPPDSPLLAAGSHCMSVDPPDHPAGGLSPLQGRLPVSNRPVSYLLNSSGQWWYCRCTGCSKSDCGRWEELFKRAGYRYNRYR